MAATHDEFNRRKAAGASASDLEGYLDEIQIPAEKRKTFKTTARQNANRANKTPEQKQAATQKATEGKANTRSVKKTGKPKAAVLDEAETTIAGHLASTQNPVKVEYQHDDLSWTSRMYPPSMVSGFLQQHPGQNAALTFSDGDTAVQHHLTRGAAGTPPAGHLTGGRTITSTSTMPSRGPNYTPSMRRVTLNQKALGESQRGAERAERMPEAPIPKPLANLAASMDFMTGMTSRRREELESRPVTEVDNPPDSGLGVAKALEVSQQAAREEHARLKSEDPQYAAQTSVAAQMFAKKDTAQKVATKRLRSTRGNVAQDPFATDTVRPVEGERAPGGFGIEGGPRQVHPEMGPDEIQGHVYHKELSHGDRQTLALHSLLQGVAAGGTSGVAHVRNAESILGVEYQKPPAPTDPGMPSLSLEQAKGITGLGDFIRSQEADPAAQQRAAQAHVHWQMGQVPMYRGLLESKAPEVDLAASTANAGGSSSGTIGDMAKSLRTTSAFTPPDVMNTVGVPHSEYQQMQGPNREDIQDPMRDAARADILDHVRRHTDQSSLMPASYATGAHASLEVPLASAHLATEERASGRVAGYDERLSVLKSKEAASQDRIAKAKDMGIDPYATPKKGRKK